MASPYPTGQQAVTDHKPRCVKCQKIIAWYVTRPWSLQCRHCRVNNRDPDHAPGILASTAS